MNARFSRSRLRLWPGVLLALAAGGVLAPPAQAGCDYVAAMPADGASLHADASANTWTKQLPSSSVPQRRPCSGPHCSGSPRTPLIPPAPPVVLSQDWAYVPAVEPDTRPDGLAYRPEDCRHTPLMHRSRIFHPPR